MKIRKLRTKKFYTILPDRTGNKNRNGVNPSVHPGHHPDEAGTTEKHPGLNLIKSFSFVTNEEA
jgi:hypothetical protein